MTGKDIFIDFINVVFTLVIIGFFLLYFIVGDRFAHFTEFMKALVPFSFFGLAFLIKLKLNRTDFKARERDGNLDITLNLTFIDKIKADIIVFSLPIIICLIPFMITRELSLINVLQAVVIFAIVYYWQKALFKKE